MLLILTLILALAFLSWPWNAAAVVAAAGWEVTSSVFWIRYSRRGRVRVGVEMLVGATASVITPLAPDGQVKERRDLAGALRPRRPGGRDGEDQSRRRTDARSRAPLKVR